MKKTLFFLLLLYGQLFALDRESTLKVYHHIFASLITEEPIVVYTTDKEYIDVFRYSDTFTLTNSIDNANIILITSNTMIRKIHKTLNPENSIPILFSTDYHLLKKYKDIVGAFYWKKGRSQLLFIESRLNKYNIKLPSEYNKFIVDEL